MKYLVLPVMVLLLIASCATQEICDDDNQAIMVARFRTMNGGVNRDTLMAGMTIYGIREGKTDSLLYDSTSEGKVQLPLDPNSDLTRFVFTNQVRSDTLSLSHSSEVYLINYTCGFASRFTLGQCTASGSWMVDVELKDAEIDAELSTDEEHLWLYF